LSCWLIADNIGKMIKPLPHSNNGNASFLSVAVLRFQRLFDRFTLNRVAAFAGNLALCYKSGMGAAEGLRTAGRSLGVNSEKLLSPVIAQVEDGSMLWESLEPLAPQFPPYFLPALRCGEVSGRTDEVLGYLETHCRLLIEPTKAMRNSWLFPLIIFVAGSLIQLAAYFFLAPWWESMTQLGNMLATFAMIAAFMLTLVCVPQAKTPLDHLVLKLPVIGPAHRDLALNRFFHAFSLLYSTSGMRVEDMIALACPVVTNIALHDDLFRSHAVIEQQGTMSEAFGKTKLVTGSHLAIIQTGEEAGKLEEAFNQISKDTAATLQHRLTKLNAVLFRVVMAAVMLSVSATIASLVMRFG